MQLQIFLSLLFITFVHVRGEMNTWPQWRGPARDGQGINNLSLIENIENQPPQKIWESEKIPSQEDGGFGSVISDGERAFISVVWHRDEPTKERILNSLVMRKLGLRNVNLPKSIREKHEQDRLELSPRLRGSKLDSWIEQWIKDNLTQKQKMTQGSLIAARFKQGKLAIPLEVIDKISKIKDRVFPSQEAWDSWLKNQRFPPKFVEEFSQGVPPTKRMADDVILALDMKSGDQIWKTKLSGVPAGRASSSTPCLAQGKIFAVGGDRLFCVKAKDGELLWETGLGSQAIASSPLYYMGKVYVLANTLRAFDSESGNQIWENSSVRGKSGSPVLWFNTWQVSIVCNSSKTTFCVNPQSGETLWEGPGGGASTPAVSGDLLVIHGKTEDIGLVCYQAKKSGINEKWKFPKLTRRTDSSPLIDENNALLFGAGMRLCINLGTGKVLRKVPAKHDISSPILVGKKVLAYEINGSFLTSVPANPEYFSSEQKFKINALKCTSPSIVGTKLLIRKVDGIACYEMGQIKPH